MSFFSFKRYWTIFRARNKEFYRDLGALGWTFLFPFLMIIGFGYMFQVGDTGLFKGGYLGGVKPQTANMQWIEFASRDEAMEKLLHHRIDLLVDVSAHPPQYWMSETSPKSRVASTLFVESIRPVGKIEAHKEVVKGREVPYVEWLFPGLLAMNVAWMALWGVGWVIVRQRKLGVLKRFKASPATPLEYLLAQMTSRMMILLLSGVMVFAGSHLIYPFVTVGSYFDIFVMYALGCISLSSIGLLVAARISSDEFANGILNMVNFPFLFLSEVWFSLEGSPEWVRVIAKGIPLWHMVDGMRKIMTEGATLMDLRGSVLMLIAIAVVFTALGSLLFKWTKD